MKLFRLLFLLTPLVLASCGSQKGVRSTNHASIEVTPSSDAKEVSHKMKEVDLAAENIPAPLSHEEDLISSITDYARQYLGTGYKYGGTNTTGMDCSGLIYTAFSKENIPLPRSSRDMALLGEELDLEEVVTGDLLFFQTNRNKKVINHVGLVIDIAEQGIFFIHSTSSRGVIISSLNERYWQEHFVMAKRIF